MKKNNFIQGAFIASFGIIICKIIGILYVIPFYAIVGTQGGALYGYAYTFYDLFTSLATIGLPFAISKIISEYYTLGYYHKKDEAYHLGLKLTTILSLICFVILYLCAPTFANMIIGDAQGGNSVEAVTTVIKVSSLSLIFVSVLSITKGYLQGHKYIAVTSMSQIIEQIVRVIIIIVGSYLALNVFNLGLTSAISIAVFGACVGAIVALIYLSLKMRKAKELKPVEYEESAEEKKITKKDLTKKLIQYALPFMFIALMTSGYEMINMFTVGPTLRSLGFDTVSSEAIVGDMTTWGSKLLSIIQAVVSGMCVSLIPHIASSYVKKDMKDVDNKINRTYQMTMFLVIPMAIGLSFLAQPVWQAFYGVTTYGPSVFRLLILSAIPSALFLISLIILQALDKPKAVFVSLLVGLIYNVFMNIPTMNFCYSIGIPAYYGAIIASIIGYILSIIIAVYVLKKDYHIDFKMTLTNGAKIILSNLIMLAVLFIMNIFIPINVSTRLSSVLIIIIYAVVGIIVYGTLTYKTKLMENVFGKEELNRILKKIPIVKKCIKE